VEGANTFVAAETCGPDQRPVKRLVTPRSRSSRLAGRARAATEIRNFSDRLLAPWGKRGSGPVVPITLSQIGAAHVVARQDATVPAPNRNESA
jgi:hypothetical protein